ncbi:hypothetical protein EJB05_30478 [Eragrostis curvula]|uniref:Uncharacterized protein n=1 Tax=Eragrostis curvula TaxID=38414 RepID=A0A5J9UBZ9_9POAL|nr:hypothetical protein EJB05_30478 [Eragrostis curvula]
MPGVTLPLSPSPIRLIFWKCCITVTLKIMFFLTTAKTYPAADPTRVIIGVEIGFVLATRVVIPNKPDCLPNKPRLRPGHGEPYPPPPAMRFYRYEKEGVGLEVVIERRSLPPPKPKIPAPGVSPGSSTSGMTTARRRCISRQGRAGLVACRVKLVLTEQSITMVCLSTAAAVGGLVVLQDTPIQRASYLANSNLQVHPEDGESVRLGGWDYTGTLPNS